MTNEEVPEWAFDWAYQHGLNGLNFNEFYEERKVHDFFGSRKLMDSWCAGLDEFNKLKLKPNKEM